MKTPLAFFARVLLLLPVTFFGWYLLASAFAAPGVWVASALLPAWLPGLIDDVYLDGATMTVISTLGERGGQFLPAAQVGDAMGFRFDTRILTYSVPFYAALHFATPLPGSLERFARGLFLLWLMLIVGLVATALKDLMLILEARFLAEPGAPPADAVALTYQFSTLIIPPLAPVLLWGWEARRSPAIQSLFPALCPATASGPEDEDEPPAPRSPLER